MNNPLDFSWWLKTILALLFLIAICILLSTLKPKENELRFESGTSTAVDSIYP